MSFEALKSNIASEKEIIREIVFHTELSKSVRNPHERQLILNAIISLKRQFNMLNDAIPMLLENISIARRLPDNLIDAGKEKPKEERLVSLSYKGQDSSNKAAVIKDIDKERFIKELGIGRELIKKIKARSIETGHEEKAKKIRTSLYSKLSNRLFSNLSNRLIAKGYFRNVNEDLKKANIPIMVGTYLSMMFFSVMAVFLISLILFILLLILSINSPNMLKFLWMIFFAPILAFVAFYFYPSSEKKAADKKINDELPFVAIHMSAIAGSGLEPTNIFRIISLGKESPYTAKEIRKLLNMINFYGMDLVSALRNTAKISPNRKLSELFNGLATTISTGGSLTEFLDKRAETLLFDFKLEKEKSTKMAETFMDIYISVAIAAPMMLVLLMVLMGISGISTFLTNPNFMAIAVVLVISLVNIIFLAFLQIKQTKF